MGWVSILATYAIVWWLVLFMVLPFGVRQIENPEPGHDPGAPARPLMLIKVAVTSGVAAILTAIIWAVIANEWIDFRGTSS